MPHGENSAKECEREQALTICALKFQEVFHSVENSLLALVFLSPLIVAKVLTTNISLAEDLSIESSPSLITCFSWLKFSALAVKFMGILFSFPGVLA